MDKDTKKLLIGLGVLGGILVASKVFAAQKQFVEAGCIAGLQLIPSSGETKESLLSYVKGLPDVEDAAILDDTVYFKILIRTPTTLSVGMPFTFPDGKTAVLIGGGKLNCPYAILPSPGWVARFEVEPVNESVSKLADFVRDIPDVKDVYSSSSSVIFTASDEEEVAVPLNTQTSMFKGHPLVITDVQILQTV